MNLQKGLGDQVTQCIYISIEGNIVRHEVPRLEGLE